MIPEKIYGNYEMVHFTEVNQVPVPNNNVAAYWKISNAKACVKKLSQIFANNIDNGGGALVLGFMWNIIVCPSIAKKDTTFRSFISPEQRLIITLGFPASEEDQKTLSSRFRIAKSTISRILWETIEAIYSCLKDGF